MRSFEVCITFCKMCCKCLQSGKSSKAFFSSKNQALKSVIFDV